MKIIFLDVDNVICTERYNLVSEDIWRDFDPVACKIILRLCKVTGAKIVLSSSWGEVDWAFEEFIKSIDKACPELKEYFYDKDFRVLKDRDTKLARNQLIKAWLREHDEVENYAIIDDVLSYTVSHKDALYKDKHLVLCNEYNGIGVEDYYRALEILKEINNDIC